MRILLLSDLTERPFHNAVIPFIWNTAGEANSYYRFRNIFGFEQRALPIAITARISLYSYRRISTGKMREAARAGISVAATLIASAAAAIQMASKKLAWNGT
jgi:hypothetical protein